MVQHLLLMLIAPPLLLMGAPVVMVLRGLPPFMQRPVFVTVARNRVMRRITRTLLALARRAGTVSRHALALARAATLFRGSE